MRPSEPLAFTGGWMSTTPYRTEDQLLPCSKLFPGFSSQWDLTTSFPDVTREERGSQKKKMKSIEMKSSSGRGFASDMTDPHC